MATTPPMPLYPGACQTFLGTNSNGWSLHKEDIQIVCIVDMVRRHVPFQALSDDTWRRGTRLEIGNEGGNTDGKKNRMLLPPRPVERVQRIVRGLRVQNGLFREESAMPEVPGAARCI